MPSLLSVALSCLGAASAAQVPFSVPDGVQHALGHGGKDLVSSAALQADIHAKNLLERAEQLYKIAELGVDEHNHPTRVIGSKGTAVLSLHSLMQEAYVSIQDT